tara:strand:- start:2181 stop:3134 length:954 start_codon:yes stop_codon:yes gene_type:complete
LNAENPYEIGLKTNAQKSKDQEKYLEYSYVEERDILFSKVIWEIIDLNQRSNFHLLYPTTLEAVGKERRPLIHYIIEGIKNGEIDSIYSDGQFNNIKTLEAFEKSLVDSVYTPDGEDKINKFGSIAAFLKDKGVEHPYIDMSMDEVDALNDDDYNDREDKLKSLSFPYLNRGEDYRINNFTYDMVDQYKIKGIWYFDKRISELVYRPLAIAPITKSVKNAGKRNKDDLSELVWVFYRHARETLKDAYVFSDKNSVVRKSFDEIINERRFQALIYLEENMYEDREVKDYMQENAFMRLLESERIKEKIRNFEHDMWSW